MTFFGLDNRTDLPKVSYSTALDIYIASCFTFVMATVIQFAIVHYFTKAGSGEHDDLSLDEESEEDTVDKKDVSWTRNTMPSNSSSVTSIMATYGETNSRVMTW